MIDIASIEIESEAATLPTEQVKEAAGLIKDSVGRILFSWEEYQKPRLMEQGTAREFTRSQGQNGEGLWVVTDYGPYIECNLANSRGRWDITVQSSDQGPRTDSVMSVQRNKKVGEREIYESPPKNSREALNLILEFVKEINGGEMPPELAKLGGEKFV